MTDVGLSAITRLRMFGSLKATELAPLVFSLFALLTIAPVLLVVASLVAVPETALAQNAGLEQAIQRHLTAQGPVAKQMAPIMADLDGDGKEEAVLYYCIDRNAGSASNPANFFCEFAVFRERNGAWAPAARVRLGQGNVQGEVGVQGGVIEAKTLTRGQQVTRRYGVRTGRLVELAGRDTSEPVAAARGSSQFATSIADVRTSTQGSTRYVALTLRFQNKEQRPLTLGYVQGSGLITDDRGNRYQLAGPIRGMGGIKPGAFDGKFTLQPGESGDARLEFAWSGSGNQIFGTVYELGLAVREIVPIAGSQWQLGQEHALRFADLRGDAAVAAAPSSPAPAPPPAPGPAETDPCAGKPRCYGAGPFAAEVTGVTTSKTGSYQLIQLNVKFRNLTNQTLVLCYASESALSTDDRGNRYAVRDDRGVKGIGLCRGSVADPQFVLKAAQSGDVAF